MKINQPVTQNEIALPPGRYIVSKTDLKGIITEANSTFVDVSGFSLDELIGQSHNLVRHPDMPPAAFEDLWRTLKTGRPWRGIVKNRCKNGDFYWVEAFVVPMRQQDRITGYMSVRTAPSRSAVQAAEALYAQLRAGQAVIPPPRRQIMLAQRINLMIGFTLLLLLGAAGAGTAGLYRLHPLPAYAGLLGGMLINAWGWRRVMSTIMHPFGLLEKRLERISEGRLTDEIDISRTDEIGRLNVSLAIMQTHLKIMLDNVLQSSLAVDERSRLIKQEMTELVTHSRLQHQATNEAMHTMKEVSLVAGSVASSAAQAADAAMVTQRVVEQSETRMDQNMEASQQVVSAVHTSSGSMTELFQSIFRIGEIAKLIKEIADQTNLLALNAAIEAARAGEQGRGFAVVADEVRKLAERTSASTVDINETVGKIETETQNAISAMNKAVHEVNLSTELMRDAEEGFRQISEKSGIVTDMSQEIAAASEEQSAATGTVTGNMENVAALIDENARLAEAASQAVEELAMISTELRRRIGEFVLI